MIFFKKKNDEKQHESGNSQNLSDFITNGEKLYDIANIHVISSGDLNFFKKLLTIFITQTPETLSKMFDAYERNDFEAITAYSHKIKPSVISLGIVSIVDDLNDLELGCSAAESERKLNKVALILNEVILGLTLEIEGVA